MSIDNIKELFRERVRESIACPVIENRSDDKNVNKTDKVIEEFESLQEHDAEITEYLNDCKGFNGVIKQRFSDFNVHEIDLDGNEVHLTNTDIPVLEKEENKEEPVNDDIFPQETWEKLKSLHDKETDTPVEIDVTNLDKEKRKEIHKAIKTKFGSRLCSNTIDRDDKKILSISSGVEKNRTSSNFPLGKYLHFVLFKKNMDSVFAINILASMLKTKASNFKIAGTKDKRANTTQWVSMRYLDAKKLNGLNKCLKNIKVGNYTYKENDLQLGDLTGNSFEIALRNVTESDDVISEALNNVKESGFINYYGLQRFGSYPDFPTHAVGKAILKRDYKLAVELILKPRKGKLKDDLIECRKIWWETRDAALALKSLKSKDLSIEGKLLMGLAKHGKNAYINALDLIPPNARLLYLHAYQSYIWNKIVSKRIKQFGKSVIKGDLVLEDPSGIVKTLTQDEIHNYDIYDIVHPLPGYNVTYPNNIIKDWYEDLLKEDELTSEDFKQKVKQFSLSGAYRHIVKKIKDFSWRICYYSEPDQDLILSDLDKMEGITLNVNSEGRYKAVILKFSLDSSTYATMALREILKIDTSSSYHSSLTINSEKRKCEENEEESRKKIKT